jgi:ABC-type hemin transport system substrate-binding protein
MRRDIIEEHLRQQALIHVERAGRSRKVSRLPDKAILGLGADEPLYGGRVDGARGKG